MPLDDEAKKIELWAETGDRTDPDDSSLTPPLDRSEGYPDSFSTAGGDDLRREVANQLLRELTGAAVYLFTMGIPEWATQFDYPTNAHIQVAGTVYRATVDTGPNTSNATDPTASGQTVWSEVQLTMTTPGKPGTPQGTVGNGRVDWVWTCPLDGGAIVSSFEVEWKPDGGSWSSPITVMLAQYSLTGLTNGTAYFLRVRAVNSVGDGLLSDEGTATPVASVPGRVVGVIPTAGDGQVGLAWEEPAGNGATISGYRIQWRETGQMFGTSRQQTSVSAATTVTTLTNSTAYFFQVLAVNSAGNGDWSPEVTATPVAPVPPPPADTAPATPPSPPMGTPRRPSVHRLRLGPRNRRRGPADQQLRPPVALRR